MRPFSAAALALFAALAVTPIANAQEHHMTAHPHMIEGALLTINAEGKVEGRPDMATVSLGVVTEGQTAAAAMSANATRMAALTQALRRAGVAERDIQTSNLNVNPQYVYGEGVPPRITGYQAQNTVTARVRNLDSLGRTLDSAIGAGGNTLNGVSFGLQQPDGALDAARREAVAAARARAALYAQAAGLTVHRIVAISEGGGHAPPVPMPMMARMEAAQAATPVSPGEVESTASVTVVFELR